MPQTHERNLIWNPKTLALATKGKVYGECYGNKLTIDSRLCEQDDIFVAFRGQNQDGHDFVQETLNNKAGAAIVEYIPSNIENPNPRLVLVENTTEAIINMGLFNRQRIKAKIIAVTGSVGKSSTKESLHSLLKEQASTFCNYGNYNGQLGIPLSLASIPLNTEYAILEMGMDRSGEMTTITNMVRPDIAVITNIRGVHLENFNSIDDIAKAKAEIFSGMSAGSIVLLNKDDEHFSLLQSIASNHRLKIFSFGHFSDADAKLLKYLRKNNESIITAEIFGREITYKIMAHGLHQALNSVIALAISQLLSLDLIKSAAHLYNFNNLKGRGKILNLVIGGNAFTLMDESYNANPHSMKAAFKSLTEVYNDNKAQGRKIAILGDMYELGANEKQLHLSLIDDLIINKIDQVITVGNLMLHLFEAIPQSMRLKHYGTHSEVMRDISKLFSNGDYILIKGSNGTKLHSLVKDIEGLQ